MGWWSGWYLTCWWACFARKAICFLFSDSELYRSCPYVLSTWTTRFFTFCSCSDGGLSDGGQSDVLGDCGRLLVCTPVSMVLDSTTVAVELELVAHELISPSSTE